MDRLAYKGVAVSVVIIGIAAEMAAEIASPSPPFAVKLVVAPPKGNKVWLTNGAKGLSLIKVFMLFMCILAYLSHAFFCTDGWQAGR